MGQCVKIDVLGIYKYSILYNIFLIIFSGTNSLSETVLAPKKYPDVATKTFVHDTDKTRFR